MNLAHKKGFPLLAIALSVALIIFWFVLQMAQQITLLRAACAGRTDEVRALLDRGANPNNGLSLEREPILVCAVHNGHLETVRLLISRGADVNASYDSDGRAALGEAASAGLVEIVKVLLENGAHPEKGTRGATGGTPLMNAANRGHVEAVKVLLAMGANVKARDHFGKTALTYTQSNVEDPHVLKSLLDMAAGAHRRYGDKRPASIEEVKNDLREVIRLLKEAGAEE
jgi:ankyrin repeat protein